MAASATFALKAGVWFRRARLFMVSPDSRAQRARCQAETPLIVLCRFPGPALRSPIAGKRNGTDRERPPSSSVLNAEDSEAVRDKLVEEITILDSAEGALAWATRRIRMKNNLMAEDAVCVERAFRERISILAPEAYIETSPSESPTILEDTAPHVQSDKSNSPPPADSNAPVHDCQTQNRNAEGQSRERGSDLSLVKLRRSRDKDHLRFIAIQPCAVCGRQPCEAHHIRYAQPRALSRKVSDEFTVPLCRVHHRELHRQGDERAWWSKLNIDPMSIALRYWQHSRGISAIARSNPEPQDSATDRSSETRTELAVDGTSPMIKTGDGTTR